MNRNYNIGVKMTRKQVFLGWLYLPFYLVLTSLALQYLAEFLHFPMTELQLNALYFSVNFLVVLAVFGPFLAKSLRGFTEHFWKFIQTLILGFALYYCTTLVLSRLMSLLAGDIPNFNDQVVSSYISQNRTVMLLISLVAAPIVEETLVRGVVFGSFHRVNRILAYAMSILLFSLMHVWQYFGTEEILPVLLSGLSYAPASIALGWSYEKSGTIWTPIVLHAIINAIAFGVSVFF